MALVVMGVPFVVCDFSARLVQYYCEWAGKRFASWGCAIAWQLAQEWEAHLTLAAVVELMEKALGRPPPHAPQDIIALDEYCNAAVEQRGLRPPGNFREKIMVLVYETSRACDRYLRVATPHTHLLRFGGVKTDAMWAEDFREHEQMWLPGYLPAARLLEPPPKEPLPVVKIPAPAVPPANPRKRKREADSETDGGRKRRRKATPAALDLV